MSAKIYLETSKKNAQVQRTGRRHVAPFISAHRGPTSPPSEKDSGRFADFASHVDGDESNGWAVGCGWPRRCGLGGSFNKEGVGRASAEPKCHQRSIRAHPRSLPVLRERSTAVAQWQLQVPNVANYS